MEQKEVEFKCKICNDDVKKKVLDFPYCRKCINEYKLSITKKCSLPQALISGKFYTLATNIQIREAKDKVRDDGKVDIEYTGWQIGEAVIQNELKQKMKVKRKGSQSELLHGQIVLSNESDRSDDEEYDFWMPKIRHYLPEIKAFISKMEEQS